MERSERRVERSEGRVERRERRRKEVGEVRPSIVVCLMVNILIRAVNARRPD
jgi:hypothetical protein